MAVLRNSPTVALTIMIRRPSTQDIYWQSRDNALLIKGGANYAYDQINDELIKYVSCTAPHRTAPRTMRTHTPPPPS
jgi:hypothetical protein